jgi:hypothetical protein
MRCIKNQNDVLTYTYLGGVRGKVIDKNSNGYTILVVAEISIGLVFSPIVSMLPSISSIVINLISTTKILIDISLISKFVPLILRNAS